MLVNNLPGLGIDQDSGLGIHSGRGRRMASWGQAADTKDSQQDTQELAQFFHGSFPTFTIFTVFTAFFKPNAVKLLKIKG